jgi:peptidoglycan lytic transglycosylase
MKSRLLLRPVTTLVGNSLRRALFFLVVFFCVSPSGLAPLLAATGAKTTAKKPHAKTSARKRRSSPRLRRMHQAFVASSSLKPMARQLLQDRTPAAYAGVEAYARRHAKEDAGALAWLVVGYAHVLDNDYAKAVDPLSRAKPLAGELGDYVSYYLASAFLQTGRTSESISALSDFDKNYPESILLRDAHLLYANALLADGRAPEAIAVLEKDRRPVRSDLELTLGRAYAATKQFPNAVPIFRNLYFAFPVSPEAGLADVELKKLASAGVQIPSPSLDELKIRADLLVRGRQYDDAARQYQALLGQVAANDRPATQLALGSCLRRAGQDKEAKKILDTLQNLAPEQEAERLYDLISIARSADDEEATAKLLAQLRQVSPSSSWLEESLLLVANYYLLKPDYDHAIDFYRELHARFPNGSHASYAHWKVAWLSLRMGRNDEAKQEFERQVALYPDSTEVPAALYWRARLAEEEDDPAMAWEFYQTISSRFRNYYYGEISRQRLRQIKPPQDPPHYAVLDHVPALRQGSKIVAQQPPPDDLRVQKAELLENGALVDFAVNELRAAADAGKGNWLASETARLYQDAGRYDMAVRSLKRAVPNYFALDLPVLPRTYWEGLFPRAYWTDLKKYSSKNSLDPYLVASLIRQESEFNPNAVSRANAVGLMQLLPKVGKQVAREEKLRPFSPNQLFTPDVNLRLGTRYFRSMVDKFGTFEYALAAYNAGSDRVQTWMGYGKYRDAQEFVESIPFTETREYVQAILRNENVYRQLYGMP